MKNNPTIIFDIGTTFIKIGYSKSSVPSFILPTILVKDKSKNCKLAGLNYRIPNESPKFKEDAIFPIKRGLINSLDNWAKLMVSAFFDHLNVNPRDYRVIIIESALSPPNQRERIAELMFETFRVKGIYIASSPLMSMISVMPLLNGKSCCIIDIGDGGAIITPIVDGFVIGNAQIKTEISGKAIVAKIAKHLRAYNSDLSIVDANAAADILAQNETFFAKDLKQVDDSLNTLKIKEIFSGEYRQLKYSKSVCEVSDILFEYGRIHEILYQVIMNCPIDSRRPLLNNLVLTGGVATIKNFNKKLQQEMRILTSESIKAYNGSWSLTTAFDGAVAFSNLEMFEKYIIKRDEYIKNGLMVSKFTSFPTI